MENGKSGLCLETVRALHQTVVALRAALEESKTEILELKAKAWPVESVEEAIRSLSIENHVLKNRLVDHKQTATNVTNDDGRTFRRNENRKIKFETKISIKTKSKFSASVENVLIGLQPSPIEKSASLTDLARRNMNEDHTAADPAEAAAEESGGAPNDLDQEVDDIELIFTTDETKDSDFKGQLVSIDDNTNLLHLMPNSETDDIACSDRELDDDVFRDSTSDMKRDLSQVANSKSDNSLNQEKSLKSCYSCQDSSFENRSLEKDESFDRFDERARIVETDISKCGIQDADVGPGMGRRNTCPNPLQYRPLLHRDALAKHAGRKARPILAQSSATRRESGAQTDISALPGSAWVSESSLATSKVRMGDNFPTLPSKFPLPGSRVRLSEKTSVEARRILLSDLGFTSMVPELSRSADHLCPNNAAPPATTSYGQFLKATDFRSPTYTTSQKFVWTTATATPSDGSCSQSRYNSLFPLASPPMPSRRCSAPVSPSRRQIVRQSSSRVRFANGSLPELRAEWFLDSGDSTDSLVEEAEIYLRRSIDCITRHEKSDGKKATRRSSAPESASENVAPQGWMPFLPRQPRDLKPDHWIKVITAEGKVRGGRVRYVGPVMGQAETFVGVQLATPDGYTDGTFSCRRYFQCEPYHGIFVTFKKVIMGWKP